MCESFGHDLCYALDDVGGGVMAHERNEYDASLQVYFVPFLVYVVTGHSGGRAVTFRDATGQMLCRCNPQ